MKVFGDRMTASEVKEAMNHRGSVIYPETEHNKQAVAAYLHNRLRELHAERAKQKQLQ